MMKQYRLYNNILGWLTFAVAAVVYLMTIEPTVSLWDCGEFIASANKLEVGHPPGAPFFMILARFFSLFAPDKEHVAMFINALSGLASAFTILFLFWTITHIAKKIIVKNNETISMGKMLAILGSGLVGALAYTFSDTFWFSAVEAEVYATSSMFTAAVFWAILKWEDCADKSHSNRWLVLIFYLMGLSIGVHLLNLLAIPAIVFVYYFKKYKVSFWGVIIATSVSVVFLAALMYGIIPGIISMASKFELLFVNGMKLPFNSGALFFSVLLMLSIVASLFFTHLPKVPSFITAAAVTLVLFLSGVTFAAHSLGLAIVLAIGIFIGLIFLAKKYRAIINTVVLFVTVVIIGYSSFAMIVIRSHADPPMDENNPDNVFALLSYLNREQYGDRPLMYGAYYNMPPLAYKVCDGKINQATGEKTPFKPVYVKDDALGKYRIVDYKKEYIYGEGAKSFFPRIHSTRPQDANVYKNYYMGKKFYVKDFDGKKIRDRDGKFMQRNRPTFVENMSFFFGYQVGHMYFRYFMWNFAGRQNDVQGHQGLLEGNWISGIKFWDAARLGPQKDMPAVLADNHARNKYYMLPLLLGLIGFIFHLSRHPKDFSIVSMLFFFTGIAIVIYLNQNPLQPRERDYAYAGSFYAFAIWIGLGVLGLFSLFSRFMPKTISAAGVTLLTLIGVPLLMASENWDDHDRSNRYTARDIAKNYLKTCEKNAILFTNGDNDTFPLWYAQEVEEFRTDIRVCNLMLFNTEWYVEQMSRKAYESEALPISIPEDRYQQGSLDYIRIENWYQKPTPVPVAVKYMSDVDFRKKITDNSKYQGAVTSHFRKYGNQAQDYLNDDHLLTNQLQLEVNKSKVFENGIVSVEDSAQVLDVINFKIPKGNLMKSEIMTLDILANFDWDRPIYWVNIGEGLLGLNDHIQHEGLAYRLVPIYSPGVHDGFGKLNADKLYDNLMNQYEWGNLEHPDVHLDEFNKHTLRVIRLRHNFTRLANHLVAEEKRDSAIQVLDRCMELLPKEKLPYDIYSIFMAESYYNAQDTESGDSLLLDFLNVCINELEYYNSFPRNKKRKIQGSIDENIQYLQRMAGTAQRYNPEVAKEITDVLSKYMPKQPQQQNNQLPIQ